MDLLISNNGLPVNTEKYKGMLEMLGDKLPDIIKEFDQFGKTQSQFMDNFFTISHPTPLRNARQILAEINSRVMALQEAKFKHKKASVKIKRLTIGIEKCTNSLDQEDLEIDLEQELTGMESGRIYIEGAVRALANYVEQYREIMTANGYDKMSEDEFEKEEERYHIMKAFDQALCAARSRGGVVDEGNHIYFSQIGVNGGMAQNFITKFLKQEDKVVSNGGILGPDFLASFLNEMAEVFSGVSNGLAQIKKIKPYTEKSILRVSNQ